MPITFLIQDEIPVVVSHTRQQLHTKSVRCTKPFDDSNTIPIKRALPLRKIRWFLENNAYLQFAINNTKISWSGIELLAMFEAKGHD